MSDAGHGGALGAVYDAKRPEEVAANYDRWAETSESDMWPTAYRQPTI